MVVFSKVLIANRGEIAVRIARTLRELEIRAVAVYSDADRGALHIRAADEAFRIGPGPADQSYLRTEVIVETALRAGAQAVHPGYGFLAENAGFARAVEEAGLIWIGPPPAAIELMGSKTRARATMRAAGVPIISGATDPVLTVERVVELGEEIGYPLIIKAAAGGGGKGMEIVHGASEAQRAFETAQRQGLKYFADGTVYVEKYLANPRHVEAQILADAHGAVLFLGERDCTIQRRHQKLVEETPSPAVDPELRERIGAIAVSAARAAGYRSAGTIEGLLTADGEFFFMEMNTRIQVEHTITELVTGIDLVREQILVAQGERLSLRQDEVTLRGHAIECRINAEDVGNGFRPTPGLITAYEEPSGPGVRIDSGVRAGDSISDLYDPMIAKLIVHDTNRETARRRMLRALSEFRIEGPSTLLTFHMALLTEPAFIEGETCHGLVESEQLAERTRELEAADGGRQLTIDRSTRTGSILAERRTVALEIDGEWRDVKLIDSEPPWAALGRLRRERSTAAAEGRSGLVGSPIQGTVLTAAVRDGDRVVEGQVLCVIEAMKMENELVSPFDGLISDLAVEAGQSVAAGQPICVVRQSGET